MSSRILPLFAFAVALAIFFLYVNPMWTGSIATANASIAADNQALVAAQQYSAQQNQLATARDAIDPSNLKALTTLLPDSVDNVGLILDINALAARSGLSVSNIDVVTNSSGNTTSSSALANATGALPAGNTNPVNSVDLSLAAVSTFSSFQNFLVGIERSARLLDIHDLVVKGSDTGVYSYQMTMRLYWLR